MRENFRLIHVDVEFSITEHPVSFDSDHTKDKVWLLGENRRDGKEKIGELCLLCVFFFFDSLTSGISSVHRPEPFACIGIKTTKRK